MPGMSSTFEPTLSRLHPDLHVPQHALHWTFTPSGGPGGQHANRSATQALLRIRITEVVATAPVKETLRAVFGEELVVSSATTRSQMRNRTECLERMVAALNEALRPSVERRPTIPTTASRQRTRSNKTRASSTKRLRRRPDRDAD